MLSRRIFMFFAPLLITPLRAARCRLRLRRRHTLKIICHLRFSIVYADKDITRCFRRCHARCLRQLRFEATGFSHARHIDGLPLSRFAAISDVWQLAADTPLFCQYALMFFDAAADALRRRATTLAAELPLLYRAMPCHRHYVAAADAAIIDMLRMTRTPLMLFFQPKRHCRYAICLCH